MAETKYGKYIICDDSARPSRDIRTGEAFLKELPRIAVPVSYLDNKSLGSSFYAECMWYHTASDVQVEPHVHDFDEVLAFFGSDPADFHELRGEIELWLGDEKHILTKSCMVYIPKGLQHCPLVFRRVDRPIFHFSAGPTLAYDKTLK
jgi:mannose-6-phosphate isomerase-like protein (cupin superfamily)